MEMISTTEQQNMKHRRGVEGTSTHAPVVEDKIVDKLDDARREEITFHPNFILALYGGELSASLYSRYNLELWEPLNKRECALQHINGDGDVVGAKSISSQLRS
jgi:hypothetical protein